MSGDMSGDEQVRAWKDPDAPGDGRGDSIPVARERIDARVHHDLDALVLQHGLELGRGFGVRPCRDLRSLVHQRHAQARCQLDATYVDRMGVGGVVRERPAVTDLVLFRREVDVTADESQRAE